ncbi:MAG: TetM/TetW/TetO/TetS family tetracycline resistance ribosomal protection protein [Lachnospiraceae bacterium]|nr:TetM/TetW/TetO/TetS family tetracycline resistance ribosomal protection protein [Lachnospiraceae bacterium]
MKNICVGLLAHVDAGKTTLSEALLYQSGAIRKAGRVDNRDAFLDTYALEKERGITIFSKMATLTAGETYVTLLDTPGHVDFSAEMERTLSVLDYAVLIVSGADGVQGHTKTLWGLLAKYEVPAFIFVNKMDQPGTDREALLAEIRRELSPACVDFAEAGSDAWAETLAMSGDEELLEDYLAEGAGVIDEETVRWLIDLRQVFPCFFGSALRMQGTAELLEALDGLTRMPEYPEEFGARAFKIARDEEGKRLTYLKVTGGKLLVKESLTRDGEKIQQIRVYSGRKYEAVPEVSPGMVCAVLGLTDTRPGQGFGCEEDALLPVLEPVLTYQVYFPAGVEPFVMLPKMRELEEEDPKLHVIWIEETQEIQVQLMGRVQLEVLREVMKERFGVEAEFGSGSILYKETVAAPVVGIGHYEPLRHYAEVHVLIEPGRPGSGITLATACSEDVLSRNWQRLILTHLAEKEHRGVLTGSPVTDVKITLIAGRAHLKHTEGGDFRQATYRAVRHGLKRARSILLEPVYEFRLEIPEENIGRAMSDLTRMGGEFGPPYQENGRAMLAGTVPVASLGDYQAEVTAYTRGTGKLMVNVKGYAPCHNAEEVIEARGYDSETDPRNPTGSVFCAHGAGFYVDWKDVERYAHLQAVLPGDEGRARLRADSFEPLPAYHREEGKWIGTDEVDEIVRSASSANRGKQRPRRNGVVRRRRAEQEMKVRSYGEESARRPAKPAPKLDDYLLVDGYNIIFAWPELRAMAETNVEGARLALQDTMCDYKAMWGGQVIVVFDAYRVKGHDTEISDYHNIHVVFTREAETADQYIEKFAHENSHRYNVTIATSDGMEQIIIRGENCLLLSARDLKDEVERVRNSLREEHLQESVTRMNTLEEKLKQAGADKIR